MSIGSQACVWWVRPGVPTALFAVFINKCAKSVMLLTGRHCDSRQLCTLLLCILRCDVCRAVSGQHTHGDMDEDEFLWNKLTGRCCFQLTESCPYEDAPRDRCKKVSPSSCKECSVWSEPDNYCHLSEANCLSCGMKLYCPRPPPLLAGNKVCTGNSRVGEGCMDTSGTGLCAARDLSDCEDACRATSKCELVVYYPEEMRRSCVLCGDLFSFEHTPGAATRAYAVTAVLAPISAHHRTYSSIAKALAPRPPIASPPPTHSALGHHRISGEQEHTECSFDAGVEYTMDQEQGYITSKADAQESCCLMCGQSVGCTDFVFEPSSRTCVLLPHVRIKSEIEAWPNPQVVSGSVKLASPLTIIPSAACSFSESTGYTLGSLGVGKPVPGSIMLSKEDCCLSCGALPQCAKFAFDSQSKTCTLHEAHAELILLGGMLSGTVQSRLVGGGEWPEPSRERAGASQAYPQAPPSPPIKELYRSVKSPPPSLRLRDGTVAEVVISHVSIFVISLMLLALTVCIYLYFSSPLLRLAHEFSGGKLGRRLELKHNPVLAVKSDSELPRLEDAQLAGRVEPSATLPKRKATLNVESKAHNPELDAGCFDGGRLPQHRKTRLKVPTVDVDIDMDQDAPDLVASPPIRFCANKTRTDNGHSKRKLLSLSRTWRASSSEGTPLGGELDSGDECGQQMGRHPNGVSPRGLDTEPMQRGTVYSGTRGRSSIHSSSVGNNVLCDFD